MLDSSAQRTPRRNVYTCSGLSISRHVSVLMSLNFELYLEDDNSQSLCSFIYQLARVLKWSVLVSVTSLISIAVLLSVIAPSQMPNKWQARKPVKRKLVLSSATATYKLQTPFTALVQKPETRKMNEFFKETTFFFIFCFSFLLIVLKFRATGILCFPNNRKYKSDRMLNFSLMRSAF